MSVNETHEFIMQLKIDTLEATRQMAEVIENFKKSAATGATVKIKPDLDADAVKTEVLGLVAQLSKITDEIEAAEKAMYDLRKEADKVGQEIDKDLVGSAEKLEAAMREGTGAAKKMMEELRTGMTKAALDKGMQTMKRAAEGMSSKWLKTSGHSDPEVALTGLLEKRRQLMSTEGRLRKAAKKTDPGTAAANRLEEEYEEVQAQIRETARALEAAFGNKPASKDLQKAIAAYDEVSEVAKNSQKLGKRMLEYLRMLRAIDQGYAPVVAGQRRAGTIAQTVEKYGVRYRQKAHEERLAAPPATQPKPQVFAPAARPVGGTVAGTTDLTALAGKLGEVNVVADPTTLINSIKSILDGPVFIAKVAADADFLLGSIRSVLANASGLKVNVAGLAAGAQGTRDGIAGGMAGATPNGKRRLYRMADGSFTLDRDSVGKNAPYVDVERDMVSQLAKGANLNDPRTRISLPDDLAARARNRRRTATERREEDRDLMSRKDWARQAGHTPEGVSAFLSRPEIAKHVPDDQRQNIQKILDYYTKVGTPDEMAKRATSAYSAINPLKDFIHNFEKSSASSDAKEMMRRFGNGFGAEFMTGLENEFKHVRDKGPARDPKGAMAGVHFAGQSIFRDEWQKRYKGIMAQANNFGSRINDMGADPLRNRWQEQTKAYLQYQSTFQKYEKAALDLAQARTMEEQRAAHLRLQSIQHEIKLGQAWLATSTLAGRGTVKINGQDIQKDAAYLRLTRDMDDRFGGNLDTYNSRKQVKNQLSSSQYLDKLFGNDEKVASDFLRQRNVKDPHNVLSQKELLANEKLRAEVLEQQIGHLREQYNIQKNLNNEVEGQVKRLDAVNRERSKGTAGGYGNAIRNGAAMIGGVGIGYTAVNSIRMSMQRYMGFQQEIAGIQGVLSSRSKDEANTLAQGIAGVSSKYGVNLLEAAQAARMLTQSGMDATKVIKELDYTMMASKGMGMTIEQTQNLQVAIKAIVEANEELMASGMGTVAVLEKISAVEARYAVESKDLGDAITMLSPILEQFSGDMNKLTDVFDATNGMVTTMVERLRITGTQAANSLKMMFSRLASPKILEKLTEDFGAKLYDKQGDLLPLDSLVAALGRRFNELQKTDPLKAKQFAVQLSGGRNVSQITTLLEGYVRMQDIATESSYAWGNAQSRADIAVDTMGTSLEKVRTSMDLFIRNLLDGTNIGEGFKQMLNGIAAVAGGMGGTGAGSLTAIAGVLGTSWALKKGKGMYDTLSLAKSAGAGVFETLAAEKGDRAGRVVKTFASITKEGKPLARVVGGLGSVFGSLASMFTPGGVLIAGALGVAAAIGGIAKWMDKGVERAERYRTTVRSLEELKIWDAPQMQGFKNLLIGDEKNDIKGIGFSTVESGYKSVISAVKSPEAQASVNKFMEVAGGKDGFDKFRKEHPEAVTAFQKEFARIFIKQLPDDVKAGFDKIEDEALRIKKVSELVGGAAFSANVQIAQAIDQVREATNRMIQDGLAGIKQLDRTARVTMMARAWGGMKDWLGVTSMQTEVGGGTNRATVVQDRMKVQAAMSKMPGFDMLAGSQLGMQAIEQAMKTLGKSNVATVIETVMNMGLPGTDLAKAVEEAMIRDTSPAEAARIRVGIYGTEAVSDADRLGITYQERLQEARERAVARIHGTLSDRVIGSTETRTVDPLLRQQTGEGYGPKPETEEEKKKREAKERHPGFALSRFEDALLDLVATVYQKIREMENDRDFAKTHRLGWDKGAQGMSLARSIFDATRQFGGNQQIDILKTIRDLETAANREFENPTIPGTNRVDALKKHQIATNKLLGDKRNEIDRFTKESISSVLGDSQEGKTVMATMERMLVTMFGSGVIPTKKELEAYLLQLQDLIGAQSKKTINDNAKILMDLEIQAELVDKITRMEEARLPLTAGIAMKAAVAARGTQLQYEAQKQLLEDRIRAGKEDEDMLDREMKKLEAQHAFNKMYEAFLTMKEAERALETQQRNTLGGMMSGFANTIKDQSIWEAIFSPKGESPEERARNKAEAIGQVFFNTLNPVFKTIVDRFTDEMMTGVADSLMEMSLVKKGLGAPENKLRTDLAITRAQYETTVAAGNVVAGQWFTQITAAGTFVAQEWARVLGVPYSPGSAAAGGGITAIGGGAATAGETPADKAVQSIEAQMKQARKNAMISGAGMMVGSVGGTMLGGGGRGAQMGSNIGSTGGMMLGSYIGSIVPGVGTVVGGAIGAGLGGLLGGFLGGKGDKNKDQSNPVIKGLDAIERAQRETITTIQAQTDALLKPENRLMALPSSMNIPGYSQNFGAGGGGAGRMVSIDRLEINIPVQSNASAQEIASAVEEAVGNILFNQGRNQSWA